MKKEIAVIATRFIKQTGNLLMVNADNNTMCINGNSTIDHDHESFYMDHYKLKEGEWDFCKTARKPYDLFVCAALIHLYHKGLIKSFNSDGDVDDWLVDVDRWDGVKNKPNRLDQLTKILGMKADVIQSIVEYNLGTHD